MRALYCKITWPDLSFNPLTSVAISKLRQMIGRST